MSFAAMIGRRRQLVVPTPPVEPEEPPPDPDGLWPNEPSGFELIADRTFSAAGGAGTGVLYEPPSNLEYVTDETGPSSPQSWSSVYPAGLSNGLGTILRTPDDYSLTKDQCYAGLIFKQSANFQQHPNACKLFYPAQLRADLADWQKPFELSMRPRGAVTSGQFDLVCYTYAGGPGPTAFDENIDASPLSRGTWYKLEVVSQLGPPDTHYGSLWWWISTWLGSEWSTPVARAAHEGTVYTTASTGSGKWVSWMVDTYFGGSAGTPIPAEQRLLINQMRVSMGA